MNGLGVGIDEPATTEGDERLASWVAALVDRISSGELLDLDALAHEHPEGVERARRLIPALAIMARLGAPSSQFAVEPTGPSAVAAGFEPGRSLGDFRTIREIGRGGMGVVYEAVQTSLNRRVALKILPMTSADDPRKLKRFQIEAQAAALLNHPHVVPVYLVGAENGAHFYAMQFIEGRTLAEVIAEFRRAPDPERTGAYRASARFAAELGRQAAQALDYAHEQGIIHRDVKPSNLLIESSGWLWVADFGLARIAVEVDQTSTGMMMGTPRYMSPEQIAGARRVVDHRTDIYSLGATLYELITLRPAFDNIDHVQLMMKIARDEPRRPRAIDPTIPRDLETIILKAMAKDPSARYSTAGALADDLGRFLEHRPIRARRPGAVDRAAKWARRHRPAVAVTAMFLLTAFMAIGGFVLWRDSVLRRHDGVLRRQNSELRSALERAERTETTIRRQSYDSRMRLAQQAQASGQLILAQEILEELQPESGGRDLRGFEWHYLWRACHRDNSVLSRHESLTRAQAISPDGRILVTGHQNGFIAFWNVEQGRERVRVPAHTRQVSGVSFSPDGRLVASWAAARGHMAPGEVTLWDAATARPIANVPQIAGYVINLEFVDDGRGLVILVHDLNDDASKNRLMFWNLARGPEHLVPGATPIRCSKMAYSRGGRWLATAATSGAVTLRDATTGESIKTLPERFEWIAELAASPDGDTITVSETAGISIWHTASRSKRGFVECGETMPIAFALDGDRLVCSANGGQSLVLIGDVRTRPRRIPLELSSGGVFYAALSRDGKTVAASGSQRSATLWDTASGRRLAEFPGGRGRVGNLIFTADGESLIVPIQDGPTHAWHFGKQPEPAAQLSGHAREVWALAYTPDCKTLVSAGDDHLIKLWNTRDGALRATLKGHEALVASVAISPDGKVLATAGFENTVRLWGLPDGRPHAVLNGHRDRVRSVVFSPDGRHIASAGSDTTVRVWDFATNKPLLVFRGHADSVRALAYEPGGAILVSASNDGTIRGIKVSEGGREAFSLGCPKPSSTLAFSPDGSLLASADESGNVTIWDAATWTRRGSVKESDTPIWGLSFSPDGRTLAAACGDAKVRLVDPITGQVVLVLGGHVQRVNAVAFSPDGQALASGSHEGAIRLWQASEPR
jgi:WD40 repeat protein